MNYLEYITEAVKTYPDGQVIFDEPLKIKTSPHIFLITVYGLCVGPYGLYVMDGGGDWYGPLLESQANAGVMISSIYQRVKMLPAPPSVVIAKYDQEVNAVIFE
jgi:hypothetical protein